MSVFSNVSLIVTDWSADLADWVTQTGSELTKSTSIGFFTKPSPTHPSGIKRSHLMTVVGMSAIHWCGRYEQQWS
jgi:hypothetical protein